MHNLRILPETYACFSYFIYGIAYRAAQTLSLPVTLGFFVRFAKFYPNALSRIWVKNIRNTCVKTEKCYCIPQIAMVQGLHL